MDYLLLLRQTLIEHMQLSPVYLKLPTDKRQTDKTIDKLVAQLPGAKEKFDWKLLPQELRPKLVPGRLRKKVEKPVDINQRWGNLKGRFLVVWLLKLANVPRRGAFVLLSFGFSFIILALHFWRSFYGIKEINVEWYTVFAGLTKIKL